MLTGSLASSLHGEPRSTHDIDVVVQLREQDIPQLLAEFSGERFYVSETAVREALAHQTMFNVLDIQQGDKIDFWMLSSDPYNQRAFLRRYVEIIEELQIPVSTPEDTILSKLRWSELSGGSEKQFTDALRVYEVQYGKLDLDYLNEWSGKLGVSDLMQKIQDQAKPID